MKSLLLLPAVCLVACGSPEVKPPSIAAPVATGPGDEITAREIASALGMHRVVIVIPADAGDASYGFTLKHADGFLPTGLTNYKAGTTVVVVYWLEGKLLKYSLQDSAGGTISSSLEVDNPVPFTVRSVPDAQHRWAPGEVFEKWSVNHSMTSSQGPERLAEGEVGICLVRDPDRTMLRPFAVKPASKEQEVEPPKKEEVKF
jgi:hypothetical protein